MEYSSKKCRALSVKRERRKKKKKQKIVKVPKKETSHSCYDVNLVLQSFLAWKIKKTGSRFQTVSTTGSDGVHLNGTRRDVSDLLQSTPFETHTEKCSLQSEALKPPVCNASNIIRGSKKEMMKSMSFKHELKKKKKKKEKKKTRRASLGSSVQYMLKWLDDWDKHHNKNVKKSQSMLECSDETDEASLLIHLSKAAEPRHRLLPIDFNFFLLLAKLGELRSGASVSHNGSWCAGRDWIFSSFRKICREWKIRNFQEVLEAYSYLGLKANLPRADMSSKMQRIEQSHANYEEFYKTENYAFNALRFRYWQPIGRFAVDHMLCLSDSDFACQSMLLWSNNSCGLDCCLFMVPKAVRMLVTKSVCDQSFFNGRTMSSVIIGALHIGQHGWHGRNLDLLNFSNWTRVLCLDAYEYFTMKKLPSSLEWSPFAHDQNFLDMSDLMTILFPGILNDTCQRPQIPFRTLVRVVPRSDLQHARHVSSGWKWFLENEMQVYSNCTPGIRVVAFPTGIKDEQSFFKHWIFSPNVVKAKMGQMTAELCVLSWMGYKNSARDHFVAFNFEREASRRLISYYDGMRRNGKPVLLDMHKIDTRAAPFSPSGAHAIALISTKSSSL